MTVRIDRCRLRGTEAAIRQGRRALAACPWPAAGDGETLILRRLTARALPQALPAHLVRAAERVIAGRVSGWSGAAAGADCVWFGSEAELLARLSLDLATGRARELWFWQSFRRYLEDPGGLARLWSDEAPRIPAACRVLRERRRLAPVWRQVDEAAAAAILPRLLPTGITAELRRATPAAGPQGGAGVDAQVLAALADFGLVPGTGAVPGAARPLLALALVAGAERPHWLASPLGLERMAAVLRALAPRLTPRPAPGATSLPLRPAAPRVPEPSSALTGRPAQAGPPDLPATDAADAAIPPPARPAQDGPPAPVAGAPGTGAAPAPAQPRPPGPDAPAAAAVRVLDRPVTGPVPPEPPAETTGASARPAWRIEQGGLFFILNLLNRRPVRTWLFEDPRAMAFPSGWGWLYRVGEGLGLEPEPALVHCLASLAGMPPERFVTDLPALDSVDEILAYGAARYRPYGIWGPGLLRRTARIGWRRPELDLDFRLADVDLDVRRAALDVDPGWVDWLGTLVRFHYRDGP